MDRIRFPDLGASDNEEGPHASSSPRWEDVTSSKSANAADLDTIIFSMLQSNWLKTARIITDTAAVCKDRLVPIEFEIIGARIQALANEGRIEYQGDLSMWRHSEVRLRQAASDDDQDRG
jgi:hypothetical protein